MAAVVDYIHAANFSVQIYTRCDAYARMRARAGAHPLISSWTDLLIRWLIVGGCARRSLGRSTCSKSGRPLPLPGSYGHETQARSSNSSSRRSMPPCPPQYVG